jgi:hypothetical protein
LRRLRERARQRGRLPRRCAQRLRARQLGLHSSAGLCEAPGRLTRRGELDNPPCRVRKSIRWFEEPRS